MTSAFAAALARTVRLSLRAGGGGLTGLLFFLSAVTVFPFGVGPDLNLLARIGPAILWISALLASLLGLDRLFQDDRDDGSLDLLVLSPLSLEMLVLAKAIGHWVATGLPLVLGAPLLGIFLNLDPPSLLFVAITLLVGTPALTLIGAIGAALMVALRRGGMMISVLVLPFTIPILIFGVSATVSATSATDSFVPPFLILCAATMFSLVVAPIAGAAAIRTSLD
ncbi:MAG: heme exporter protein CcmB [Bauldia sp.]